MQLLFARALEDQGLLGEDGLPLDGDHNGPILVAWSDNGSVMTTIDTRQFMALMAIAQHHGRRGTPDRPVRAKLNGLLLTEGGRGGDALAASSEELYLIARTAHGMPGGPADRRG